MALLLLAEVEGNVKGLGVIPPGIPSHSMGGSWNISVDGTDGAAVAAAAAAAAATLTLGWPLD